MESVHSVLYKGTKCFYREKQNKIFIQLFETKPEFSIKRLKKINEHIYVICKLWTSN